MEKSKHWFCHKCYFVQVLIKFVTMSYHNLSCIQLFDFECQGHTKVKMKFSLGVLGGIVPSVVLSKSEDNSSINNKVIVNYCKIQ